MPHIVPCVSLAAVRHYIDRLDRQLVALVAERGAYVHQAAAFRKSADQVPAPLGVAEVQANEFGAEPAVVDLTWRAMIAAFIDVEQDARRGLHPPSPTPH